MPRLETRTTDEALAAPAPLRPDGVALFLDLDGVLAPISPRPEDVRPDAQRTVLLKAVSRSLEGRLAVISGRTIADIDRILDGAVAVAAGVHGLERRFDDGHVWRAEPSAALGAARAAFEPLARAWPGVWIEDKGLSLAIHYRAAPDALSAVTDMVERLTSNGALTLQLQWGQMVAELRTPGPDKGDALSAFMTAPPFIGAMPVFVGDDLTDEHGFAAAAAADGYGVLVGPLRPTAARARLKDVEAVFDWLGAAVAGREKM